MDDNAQRLLKSSVEAKKAANGTPNGVAPGKESDASSDRPVFNLSRCLNELKVVARENHQLLQNDPTELGQGIDECFLVILETAEPLESLADYVQSRAHEYDFDDIQANGYRSILRLLELVSTRTKNLVAEYSTLRNSFFFHNYYHKKILCFSEAFRSAYVFLKYSETLMSWSETGSLFPRPQGDFTARNLFVSEPSKINQYSFYGRLVGFQFCESLANIFKALSILMASFSEMYYSDGSIINPLWRCGKYLIDAESRAKRIVNISQYASAYFCKSFWLLGEMELMQRLPSFSGSLLAINKVIAIQPESLALPDVNGRMIDIPVPSSHKGPAPLTVRLISASCRLGMTDDDTVAGLKFPSDEILIHCHGGGFVAQSSKSHETYLRQWAIDLDCPILSIDYSLAPEAPYPRALEEAFFAYCWALKNAAVLGTTCQRVVFAGDSAGANLVMSMALMCIDYGVRIPDGIFIAYAPMYLKLVPSPARLLCLVDPLLPFGFVLNCTKAYVCDKDVFERSQINEKKLKSVCLSSLETPRKEKRSGVSEDLSPGSDDLQTSERPVLMGLSQTQPDSGIWARFVASLQKFTNLIHQPAENEDELKREILNEAFQPCPYDMLDFDVPLDPLVSPFIASEATLSKFPPVSILTTEFDPFLDDDVEMSKRLQKAGVSVTLDVLPDLAHGFLNFTMLSKESLEGSKICIKRMKALLRADCGGEEVQQGDE